MNCYINRTADADGGIYIALAKRDLKVNYRTSNGWGLRVWTCGWGSTPLLAATLPKVGIPTRTKNGGILGRGDDSK